MKGMLIGVMAALLFITGSGTAAHAQEGTEAELGIKMWWNEWERDFPDIADATSDTALLIGPGVMVKFRNQVFVDASYLFSTSDYKFSEAGLTTKLDRQDADFAIGYMIIPEFGILAGYRNVWFDEEGTGLKETIYGPIIGILGSAPVNEAFSFYTKINYQFTRFKEKDEFGTFREDNPGWIAEIGAKYAFTWQFSGRIAYRYETNKGEDSDVRDTFSGLALSAMFAL